jgi:hypothetical protein
MEVKMSKQTAVEWLVEEYAKAFKIPLNTVMQETIQRALAMEREQIVESHLVGQEVIALYATTGKSSQTSIQYYNETYKGADNE